MFGKKDKKILEISENVYWKQHSRSLYILLNARLLCMTMSISVGSRGSPRGLVPPPPAFRISTFKYVWDFLLICVTSSKIISINFVHITFSQLYTRKPRSICVILRKSSDNYVEFCYWVKFRS